VEEEIVHEADVVLPRFLNLLAMYIDPYICTLLCICSRYCKCLG